MGDALPPGDAPADGGGTATAAMASRIVDQPELKPERVLVPPGPVTRIVGVDVMPSARPAAVSAATAVATDGSSRQAVNDGGVERGDPCEGDEVRSRECALVLGLLGREQEVVVAPVGARILAPGAPRRDRRVG